MTSTQGEKFFGPSSKGTAPDPRLPPDEFAKSQGRIVVRTPGTNHFTEYTPGVVNPPTPEPPAPGVNRVKALINAQADRVLTARSRAATQLAAATVERDRLAKAFAQNQFSELRDSLETAQRELSLVQATSDAAESEFQRVSVLQTQASKALLFNKLADLDAAQSDEAWATEQAQLHTAMTAAAQAIASAFKVQRERAEAVSKVRAEARALSRDLELGWQEGRHGVHDRTLAVAAEFRRLLLAAGLSMADFATLTRA